MYRGFIGVETRSTCPVCSRAAFRREEALTDDCLIICAVCGKFRYSATADLVLQGAHHRREADLFYRISYHLRSIAERALGKRDNSFFPLYSAEDFEQMKNQPDPPVQEKMALLLRYLAGLSEYPGQLVRFSGGTDLSVLNAKNASEADFHMRALHEQGLISWSTTGSADQAQLQARFGVEQGTVLTVTPQGWSEVARLSESGSQSAIAFVAMWFDGSRRVFDEAIQRAVRSAGYDSIRIDRVQHVNRIDDEIIAQIRRSKFLIADFSGQRGGVYFEAGFMLGLGRPVIWLCQKPELQDVHFDTRQYNFIDYADEFDLEHRLHVRIEAIFGKGPRPNAT
jgi:hypothetical protein